LPDAVGFFGGVSAAVDAKLFEVPRDVEWERQLPFYSGKHKAHGVKYQW
jgi:hypothetical protein